MKKKLPKLQKFPNFTLEHFIKHAYALRSAVLIMKEVLKFWVLEQYGLMFIKISRNLRPHSSSYNKNRIIYHKGLQIA